MQLNKSLFLGCTLVSNESEFTSVALRLAVREGLLERVLACASQCEALKALKITIRNEEKVSTSNYQDTHLDDLIVAADRTFWFQGHDRIGRKVISDPCPIDVVRDFLASNQSVEVVAPDSEPNRSLFAAFVHKAFGTEGDVREGLTRISLESPHWNEDENGETSLPDATLRPGS